jgi:hypothetical protein
VGGACSGGSLGPSFCDAFSLALLLIAFSAFSLRRFPAPGLNLARSTRPMSHWLPTRVAGNVPRITAKSPARPSPDGRRSPAVPGRHVAQIPATHDGFVLKLDLIWTFLSSSFIRNSDGWTTQRCRPTGSPVKTGLEDAPFGKPRFFLFVVFSRRGMGSIYLRAPLAARLWVFLFKR